MAELIQSELIRLGVKDKYGCELIYDGTVNEINNSPNIKYATIKENYDRFDKNRYNKDGYIFLQEYFTVLHTEEHLKYLQEFESIECLNNFLFRIVFDAHINKKIKCDRLNFIISENIEFYVFVQFYSTKDYGVKLGYYVYEKIKE